MSKEAVIETKEDRYKVEVADSLLKRAWGLSLSDKGKMLFVFPGSTNAKIDMMMLSDPLWLYFLNEQKQVISVQKAMPWGLDPRTWRLYSPDENYSYLIESFDKLDLEKEDEIDWKFL